MATYYKKFCQGATRYGEEGVKNHRKKSRQKLTVFSIFGPVCPMTWLDCAKLGDVCTYGILYSVGRLLDRATDRAAYNKPKV